MGVGISVCAKVRWVAETGEKKKRRDKLSRGKTSVARGKEDKLEKEGNKNTKTTARLQLRLLSLSNELSRNFFACKVVDDLLEPIVSPSVSVLLPIIENEIVHLPHRLFHPFFSVSFPVPRLRSERLSIAKVHFAFVKILLPHPREVVHEVLLFHVCLVPRRESRRMPLAEFIFVGQEILRNVVPSSTPAHVASVRRPVVPVPGRPVVKDVALRLVEFHKGVERGLDANPVNHVLGILPPGCAPALGRIHRLLALSQNVVPALPRNLANGALQSCRSEAPAWQLSEAETRRELL